MSEESYTTLAIKYLEQSSKYQDSLQELIWLKQQIKDAEEVIKEYKVMTRDLEIARKYWEKYGANNN